MIWDLDGIAPHIAPDAWVAPDAQLMGRVVLEAQASVWFGAVLRGDNEEIRLGRGSNIQDLCVCHTDPGYPLIVGENCTIGHRAILHGCTIGDGVLIGMGAIILNKAVVGAGSVVGAGALVTQGTIIPPHSLVVGAPAKVRRELSEEERAHYSHFAAKYVGVAANYRRAAE